MPTIDAMPPLAYVKGIRTDATGDHVLQVPLSSIGWGLDQTIAYNSPGDQGAAQVGVYTGPGGTGQIMRAPFTLASLTGPAHVRSLPGNTFALNTPICYVRVTVASGVPGSTVDVAIYGYALP